MNTNRIQKNEDPRECLHKRELNKARWILRDENGLRYTLCYRCWWRVRNLAGFTVIEYGDKLHQKRG